MTVPVPCKAAQAQEQIHVVPVALDYSGEAKVDTYFSPEPSRSSAGEPILTASLRGRALKGKEVELPEGVVALVLRSDRPEGEEGEAQVTCVSSSARVVSWNHDSEPTSWDPLPRALDWIPLARKARLLNAGWFRIPPYVTRPLLLSLAGPRAREQRGGGRGTRSSARLTVAVSCVTELCIGPSGRMPLSSRLGPPSIWPPQHGATRQPEPHAGAA